MLQLREAKAPGSCLYTLACHCCLTIAPPALHTAPLTLQVMVMETTGALQLIVPLMLTVFFAKVVRLGLGSLWSLACKD